MSKGDDLWPIAPSLLEDPHGAADAWLTRASTVCAVLGTVGMIVKFPVGLLALWRTGRVTRDLELGTLFLIIGFLCWLHSWNPRRRTDE